MVRNNDGGEVTSTEKNALMGDAKPVRKKRRLVRWLVAALVVVLIGIPCIALLVPTLLSTGAGKNFVLGIANDSVAGRIEMDQLSLAWFGGQKVTNLKVIDPAGDAVLTVGSVDVPDVKLFSLLTGSREFGEIRIDGLKVNAKQAEDGKINLLEAVKAKAGPAASGQEASGSGGGAVGVPAKIVVTGIDITYATPQADDLRITGDSFIADLRDPSHLTANTALKVAQGASTGRVEMDVDVKNLLTKQGELTPALAQVSAKVNLLDLPVSQSGQLAEQADALAALIGDKANLRMIVDGTLEGGSASVAIESRQLNGSLSAKASQTGISLGSGSALTLQVTPKAWAAMRHSGGDGAVASELQKPFNVKLSLSKLEIPRRQMSLDFAAASASLMLAIDDIMVKTNDPAVGDVALRDARFAVESSSFTQQMRITLSAVAQQEANTGNVEADLTVIRPFDASMQPNVAGAGVKGHVHVGNLALAVVDQLLGGGAGLVTAALGQKLNADIKSDITMTDGTPAGTVHLSAKAERLDANLNARLSGDVFELVDGGRLMLAVEPALVAKLLGPEATMSLLRATNVTLDVKQLRVPRSGSTWDAGNASMDVSFAVAETAVDAGEKLGTITLSDFGAKLNSPKLSSQLDIAFGAVAKQNEQSGRIDATVSVRDGFTLQGQPDMERMTLAAKAAMKDWPVALVDQIMGMDGLLPAALGPMLAMDVQADIKPDAAAGKASGTAKVTMTTRSLAMDVNADVTAQSVTVRKGSGATLTVDPSTFADIMTRLNGAAPAATLAAPAKIRIDINTLAVPTADFDLKRVRAGLKLGIDRLAVAAAQPIGNAELTDLSLTLADASLADPLAIALASKMKQGQYEGSLAGNLNVTNALDASRTIALSLRSGSLPMGLFDALAGQNGKLVALLGDRIDSANLEATIGAKQDVAFDAKVQAPQFNVAAAGEFVPDSHLNLRDGSTMNYTLTPAAFGVLTATDDPARKISLTQPAQFKLAFDQAKLTMGEKPAAQVRVNVTGSDFTLTQAGKPPVAVKGLNFKVDCPGLNEIAITGGGRLGLTAGAQNADQGNVTTDVKIANLFDGEGKVSYESAAMVAKIHLIEVPLDPLDAMFSLKDKLGFKGPVSGVVGETATLTIDISDPGRSAESASGQGAATIDFELKSRHIQSDFRASVDGGLLRSLATDESGKPKYPGTLKLRSDSVTVVQMSEALAQEVLARVNPIFVNAVASEEPIQLTIASERFSMPISAFDMAKVGADAQLKLGTLTIRSGGVLSLMLQLLRQPESREVKVQLTPLNAHIDKGRLSYSHYTLNGKPAVRDMVARIGNLEIGFGGQVDLVQKTLNVETAFYSHTLAQAYPELRKVMGRYDAVVLPMTGTTTEPKMDSGRFLQEIGKLSAQAALGERGGAAVGLIGGLLNAQKQQQSSVPAGTDRRAPEAIEWEKKRLEELEKQQQQSQQNQPAPETQPQQAAPAQEQPKPAAEEEKKRDPARELLRGLLR